jgi:hypothetical protein
MFVASEKRDMQERDKNTLCKGLFGLAVPFSESWVPGEFEQVPAKRFLLGAINGEA